MVTDHCVSFMFGRASAVVKSRGALTAVGMMIRVVALASLGVAIEGLTRVPWDDRHLTFLRTKEVRA